MSNERVPIVRRNGITIYGRVIDGKNKLGRYEVYSDEFKNTGTIYHQFSDAERRMSELEYLHDKKNER